MSDGARCHYCRKVPCQCDPISLPSYAVVGRGYSGTYDDYDEAVKVVEMNKNGAVYEIVARWVQETESVIDVRSIT